MSQYSVSRRAILAGIAGATLSPLPFVGQARAAEFKLKFGNDLDANHPMNIRANEAAKRILERTSGKVDFAVFPSNALGGQTDMISQVRSGGTEFVAMSCVILGSLVPISAISGVGFAFKDYKQVWGAMDGSLGASIRASIEKVGLIPLDKVWDNGFRQTTTSNRPINVPDDFKGMKIRVPVAKLWVSLFGALGATPTSMNFSETYSALQTKVVDGMENSLATLYTSRIYEVQKYCSLTSHMWDGFWMLGNRRALSYLPNPIRDIVFEELTRAIMEARVDTEELNGKLAADLNAKGMTLNETDPVQFRAALAKTGFYDTWKKTFGDEAWNVLESNVGSLG